MFKVYGDVNSGNCYKVKLVLEQLGLDYDWLPVDILAGENTSVEFLKINPVGKIPVLVTNEGKTLSESNAIIWFLADGTKLIPNDEFNKCLVLQWLFFEQYSHEPNIASARFIVRYLNNPKDRNEDLKAKIKKGYEALHIMEDHLEGRDFFVGNAYSIADICLFAYTHVSDEGGFSLEGFSNILRWISKVKSQKGFAGIG